MERIGRPEDDFRERLTEDDLDRIFQSHGLPHPTQVVSEPRGNETVCYHVDSQYFIAFVICEDIHWKVEVLSLLHGIAEIPTPPVIAWCENDSELSVPYMITERCPGHRLDALWRATSAEQHKGILEALGAGTGRYHTVSAAALVAHAESVGLSHRVQHIGRPHPKDVSHHIDSLPTLSDGLRRIGIDANSIVKALEKHFSHTACEREEFIAPGLVHTEPCAEHFFIADAEKGYRLSGCVDLNFSVSDPLGEITSHYVSMLSLDPGYFSAFKRGYERFFPFPVDAKERLRIEAIEDDLGDILWLLDTMEGRPEWAFSKTWVEGHLRRLEGWLDRGKRIDRALFREDIGPW